MNNLKYYHNNQIYTIKLYDNQYNDNYINVYINGEKKYINTTNDFNNEKISHLRIYHNNQKLAILYE